MMLATKYWADERYSSQKIYIVITSTVVRKHITVGLT